METLDDHVDWVMEDSPLFLTNEEVDALGKVLANMTIQSLSNNIGIFQSYFYFKFVSYLLSLNANYYFLSIFFVIGPLNLDDHDVDEALGNPMVNMNLNESNVHHETIIGDSS